MHLQKSIPNIRLFERHVGQFFTHNNRPIKINRAGMSDLYGLLNVNGSLHHIEIEIKTGNAVLSKDQKIWKNFIESFNGLYIVGRDVSEIEQEIAFYIRMKEV